MNPVESELLSGASLASPKASRRRFARQSSGSPQTLPGEQIDLLLRWLRPQQTRRKWSTLLADAGSKKLETAMKLADWLLHNGWAEHIEKRMGSRWEITWLEFPRLEALRKIFKLPDTAHLAREWVLASAHQFDTADLAIAHATLENLPLSRRLKRLTLLEKMENWRIEQRQGTRRDFALYARADTKGISAAEWTWLDAAINLQNAGIFEHTPHLLIAAPIRLYSATSCIDLNASADWIALTPDTVTSVIRSEGLPRCWRLVENLTSFERVARQRASDEAVVWLPGFAPGWWFDAMLHLVRHSPAAAEIACDPDPAGIAIALHAARLWEECHLPWLPFRMDAKDLTDLRQRKPLNQYDLVQLERLFATSLPHTLRHLAETMLKLGEKGEQEAYL